MFVKFKIALTAFIYSTIFMNVLLIFSHKNEHLLPTTQAVAGTTTKDPQVNYEKALRLVMTRELEHHFWIFNKFVIARNFRRF